MGDGILFEIASGNLRHGRSPKIIGKSSVVDFILLGGKPTNRIGAFMLGYYGI